MCDVVGFGENSVDLMAVVPTLPAPDGKAQVETLRTQPGGQVATAMVGCARLGVRACYLGTFGNDPHGRLVQAAFAEAGVDTASARTVEAPNRTAIILVDAARGSRMVLGHRDPALDWPPEELPIAALHGARVLLVDATDVPAATRVAAAARELGLTTVADVDGDVPGLDGLLRLTNVLVVSENLVPDMRRLHRQSGAVLVVATLGPDGAVAWDGEQEIHVPGFVVPVVDTTGAGDAFRAGLITAMLDRKLQAADCLEFANAVAALNCRALGAQAGLPTRADVDTFVTSADVVRSKGSWGRNRMESQPEGFTPGESA
ncbi:MAG: carbohydrate kinase family protein [Acidobacteria bacterium]|nr:carbohydrate kinase family protein [Acidobacteriota bacterium]